MDDTQFGAVLMTLGTSAPPNSEILLAAGLFWRDTGEDAPGGGR
jgi:hypothetical protein